MRKSKTTTFVYDTSKGKTKGRPIKATLGEWNNYHSFTQFALGCALGDVENKSDLNRLARQCRKANDKWWRNPKTGRKIKRNKGELLMLIVSEIAEAMEGERKDLMDDHMPTFKMVDCELADALIRIFDYCGEYKIDIGRAFVEKMKYNATRKDHSIKARLGKHGKKF